MSFILSQGLFHLVKFTAYFYIIFTFISHRLHTSAQLLDKARKVCQWRFWHFPTSSCSQLLLWPSFSLSSTAIESSSVLQPLVFTSHTSHTYTHTLHFVLSLRGQRATAELKEISSTVSETRDRCLPSTSSSTGDGEAEGGVELRECVPTDMPAFLLAYCPKVSTFKFRM